MTRILTCEENISFYGSPQSWPVFHIGINVILIQRGLLELFSTASGVAGTPSNGDTHSHQFFQSVWLGKFLKMAVNNPSLRWSMIEGNMGSIRQCSWSKVRYESYARLYPLRRLYRENIWQLKLKDGCFDIVSIKLGHNTMHTGIG